jgi:hypothetical protein
MDDKDESQTEEFKPLTKGKFIEYCKLRKEMDTAFGKDMSDRYNEKLKRYEEQKAKQREKYKEKSKDIDFLVDRKIKLRDAYLKRKEKEEQEREELLKRNEELLNEEQEQEEEQKKQQDPIKEVKKKISSFYIGRLV